EPPVAVVGALRDRLTELAEAVGDADRGRIAPRVAGHSFEPLDAGFETLQRVEPVARVCADRIPGVAESRSAPHCRAALAADPDRHPLLHWARLEEDVGELRVFAAET